MAYTACTDKDCTWDATGETGDVERAYKTHRKQHPVAKAQASADAVSVPESETKDSAPKKG